MSWGWGRYPESKPRRPADGIRAQSGRFGETWWSSRWLTALDRLVDPARLRRGRSYARSGQVLNIDITPGQVASRVQGSRATPYKVRIKIKPLSDREWEEVVDAMAAQAIFAAKLLAGEMPQEIEEAFAQAGVQLFPSSRGDLETECSCPDWANPCKHVAAVYYLLGEQFDGDPFVIFRLRGKGRDEIMAMLRARRTMAGSGVVETFAAEAQVAESAVPLEECLDHFWDSSANLDDFRVVIEGPGVDGVPVKRLGAPGFWRDSKVDFVAMLTQTYQAVTKASLDVALGDGPPEPERTDG